MTDRATSVQFTQAREILGSGLFTEVERRRWLLEIGGMTRFEARWAITVLAEEYKSRKRAAA